MIVTQPIDMVPIVVLIVLFGLITFACYEVGYRVGIWWQKRMPGEQEGPTGTLVGALLGLMAFLLAVTMGMAAERFDARRALVMEEATTIGQVYLQAGYLPEPQTDALREMLREYLPLRVSSSDLEEVEANIASSRALHPQMWAIVAEAARSGYNPDLMSSLGESMTEIVALDEARVVAGLYARVPETIIVLLLAGSALALGMVGYSAGLSGSRSILSAIVLIVALGAVMTLVIDLDRPQEGFLKVSQRALIDVQSWIGQPSP